MAINLSDGFNITVAKSVDARLILSKEEMKAMKDVKMPSNYFCICSDDNELYLYQKTNTIDDVTGRFRLYQADLDENTGYILDGGFSNTII